MIDIKGYKIKNDLTEMTVGEFEDVSNILNDGKLEPIEKWIQVIESLGTPEEIVNQITNEEFFDIVGSFNVDKTEMSKELVKSIEMVGYNFISYEGDEFRLKIKDTSLIEKYIKKDKKYLSKMLAVIFKREGLTNNEHYDQSHIDYKAKLISDMKIAPLYPYIIYVSEQLGNKLKVVYENSK